MCICDIVTREHIFIRYDIYKYIHVWYFLICRFVDRYVKTRPFPSRDGWWLGGLRPGVGPPGLGLGSPSLGLLTPSLGSGTQRQGLGTPSLRLGFPSLGLGTQRLGLGTQA